MNLGLHSVFYRISFNMSVNMSTKKNFFRNFKIKLQQKHDFNLIN